MAYYEWLFWGTIGLHCVSTFIIFVVFVYYLAQYCCNGKNTENIKLPIKILTVIGSFACLLCAISDGLTVYIDKDTKSFTDIWYNTQAISHAVNNLMTYCIYIYRLHLSFKDTMYRIGTLTYGVLTAFITLDLLDFFGDSAAYFYDETYLLYLDVFGLFTETMISILCLYLFNKNLFSLMLKMRTSIDIFDHPNNIYSPYSYSMSIPNKEIFIKSPVVSNQSPIAKIINDKMYKRSGGGGESIMDQLNERQKRLIDRIVRNALLCSLTMLVWTLERIAWFLFIFRPKTVNSNLMFCAKCLTATALMVDAICMLFTFKFATILYTSFCVSCDKCCHSCCGCCVACFADIHEDRL